MEEGCEVTVRDGSPGRATEQSGSPGWQPVTWGPLGAGQSDRMAAPSPTTKALAYRDPPPPKKSEVLDLNYSSHVAAPAGKGPPTCPEGRATELEKWDSLQDTCGPRCVYVSLEVEADFPGLSRTQRWQMRIPLG